MTHSRTELRNDVKTLLLGLPTTGDEVYVGRTRGLEERHSPTLLIYTPNEISGRAIAGNPAGLGRSVQLVIEGRVSEPDPPDDLLDVMDAEVTAKLRNAEEALGVFDIMRVSTAIDVRADGARHLGEINLIYQVRYSEPAEDE